MSQFFYTHVMGDDSTSHRTEGFVFVEDATFWILFGKTSAEETLSNLMDLS